jgi:hypothetical protein
MPPIDEFKCNKCDFSLPRGWGGYMYVLSENGERLVCPHPAEYSKIKQVLGHIPSEEEIKQKTGFNSYCVCLDCLHQFELDLGKNETANPWRENYSAQTPRDKRQCPECHSTDVKTEYELIGEPCPKCRKGKIKKISTGIMS